MLRLLPVEMRSLVRGTMGRYLLATLMWALANGLVMSLGMIYITRVHHFSTMAAAELLTAGSLLVLIMGPFFGSLSDRIGPSPVLAVLSFTNAASTLWWALSMSHTELICSFVLTAVSGAGLWGQSSVLLARITHEEDRQRAFGVNFMLVNLGIGCGGLVSASVVSVAHPLSFRYLYIGTSVGDIVYGLVLLSLWSHGQRVPAPDDDHIDRVKKGWGTVLRDRRLVHFLFASTLLAFCGYASLEVGLSLFVVNRMHLSVAHMGIAFACNTGTIVLVQIFSLRLIEGRSRTRVIGVVGLLWSASWICVGLGAHVGANTAMILLCLSTSIFAVGETLWSPVAPAMVNQISPDELRGRYNAAQGLTWSLSGTLAPLLAGSMLAGSGAGAWPFVVAGGCLVGGLLGVSLRRSLSAVEDGRVADQALTSEALPSR